MVEIEDYSFNIDSRNIFDHPVKNDIRTYENIRNQPFATGQWDDYTTGCFLDYPYLKWFSIQDDCNRPKQTANTWFWSKSNLANKFYRKSTHARNKKMIFIMEEVKETILAFSQGPMKIL